MKSCGVAEKHLREPVPNVEKALVEIELARKESVKGHRVFNKWMIENVWRFEIGKPTAARKMNIERKKGLSFPYYDAIEEGMTEVGEFITKSYGLRELVYDMFLVMATIPQMSDDQLPPTFRSLWEKPEEQARVAAEHYVLALWKMKAQTLFPAAASSDVFNQVFWHLNELITAALVPGSNLPLGYRESSLEERRRLSWRCTVQALVFYEDLKRTRTDWERLVMKRRRDTEDQFETILDGIEKYFERKRSQSIVLDILLPPEYCSLEKKGAMKSMRFPERRRLLERWIFNVLKPIVQWLFIKKGWRLPVRKEAGTKVDGNLFEDPPGHANPEDSKDSRIMKSEHRYFKEKENPCDGKTQLRLRSVKGGL
ncbi:uncharacterized protein PAC_07214 [Phialocephala subalpina]|uniref:Uncharacterized protein n=1 Tax=Phialocephala subalpina TaxID=576137 RepID=A0A1L7WX27_9HELO|nr:uncharacterized protein PAC_07214 [Phialocephala subalpina]